MDECIGRKAAIAIIEEKQKELCPVGRYGRGYVYGSDRDKYDAWDEIIDALENIPSADVAPVVHGRWIEKWDLYDKGFYISRKVWYECSNCGMKTHYRDECFEKEVNYNYCPNCGAKMDGGADLEDD